MVGVQLCSSWASTRRKNGDLLREQVSTLMGMWRTGKFMPLVLRPFSVNTYALSKVWFRSTSVNLREGDFTAINSAIKKWLYSDLLFKPETLLLYRPVSQGGLGLISVKLKAQALFLRNFLDMACNPLYIHSQYLNTIYRAKVLDEAIECPVLPPYFQESFFMTIKEALQAGRCVSSMKTKQWYQFLHQREFSVEQHLNNTLSYIPRRSRVESLLPNNNWDLSFHRLNLPHLHSDVKSFGWKMVHHLLPCEEVVSRKLGHIAAACRFACEDNPVADLSHCFFFCHLTESIGSWILDLVRKADPVADCNSLICIGFSGSDSLVWLVLNALYFSWSRRCAGKPALLSEFLASIESDVLILSNDLEPSRLIFTLLDLPLRSPFSSLSFCI